MTEPRRVSYGNIRHKLEDIIIEPCTAICGGEDYNDMEAFGREHEEWLRNFLELPNGIPDSDTFRRLFEGLNPAELSMCLYDWLDLVRERSVEAEMQRTKRITWSVPLLPKIKSHSVRSLCRKNVTKSVQFLRFLT